MPILRLLGAILLTLLLAACAATGPTFTQVRASIPPLHDGDARIFFYREAGGVGLALKPEVRVNGQPVGQLPPGSFLFVDRSAGHFTATAGDGTDGSVTLDLPAGETAYVRMEIAIGLVSGRVLLSHEGSTAGSSALGTLAYVGATPLAASAQPGTGAASEAPPPTRTEPPPSRGAVTLDDLSGLLPPKR